MIDAAIDKLILVVRIRKSVYNIGFASKDVLSDVEASACWLWFVWCGQLDNCLTGVSADN